MKRNTLLIVLLISLLYTLQGCEKNFNDPVSIDMSRYPQSPTKLKAEVGDEYIRLSWKYENITKIEYFYIFRKDTLMDDFVKIDSTENIFYEDENVKNGMIYEYYISSFDDNHFEGKPSQYVLACPGIYSLLINNGVGVAETRKVTLTMIAPENTQFMQISNDSLFSDVVWEPFATTRQWLLTEGDGLKTIYARFLNEYDNTTFGFIKNRIILRNETRSNFAPVTLRIYVELENFGFSLTWDQSNYERFGSYRLFRSTSSEVNDELTPIFVTRNRDENYYKDIGLNSATTYYYRLFVFSLNGKSVGSNLVSATTIANKPPKAVTLAKPLPITKGALKLTWSQNRDNDFDSYRIYRSKVATIDSTLAPVIIISDQQITSYEDKGLENNTFYYYQLFVFDQNGLRSGSNEVEGKTLP